MTDEILKNRFLMQTQSYHNCSDLHRVVLQHQSHQPDTLLLWVPPTNDVVPLSPVLVYIMPFFMVPVIKNLQYNAVYIRLSSEDNDVEGSIKAESNSVSAQRMLIEKASII